MQRLADPELACPVPLLLRDLNDSNINNVTELRISTNHGLQWVEQADSLDQAWHRRLVVSICQKHRALAWRVPACPRRAGFAVLNIRITKQFAFMMPLHV